MDNIKIKCNKETNQHEFILMTGDRVCGRVSAECGSPEETSALFAVIENMLYGHRPEQHRENAEECVICRVEAMRKLTTPWRLKMEAEYGIQN